MKENKNIILKIVFSFLAIIGIAFFLTLIEYGKRTSKKVEAPVIVSLEDFGCENSEAKYSTLDTYEVKNGKKIDLYNLYLKSYDGAESIIMEIFLYNCDDEIEAKETFEAVVVTLKDLTMKESCQNSCYYPPITFETATKDMYPINLEEWGVDYGYSSLDYRNIPADYNGWFDLFLVKDNKVLHMEIDKDMKLTPERINEII